MVRRVTAAARSPDWDERGVGLSGWQFAMKVRQMLTDFHGACRAFYSAPAQCNGGRPPDREPYSRGFPRGPKATSRPSRAEKPTVIQGLPARPSFTGTGRGSMGRSASSRMLSWAAPGSMTNR